MSITSSTMKCPTCADQLLETLSAPIGVLQRCPACSGLFLYQDLIIQASEDRARCLEALEETKSLLLPTERWCPKCLQKLYDGRVRSRGVIFSLCPACQSYWTTLALLRSFEEPVEKTLRLQIEIAATSGAADSLPARKSTPAHSEKTLYEDRGLGRFFRSFARAFDGLADRFSRTPKPGADNKSLPPRKKPLKKPLILEVEPQIPAATAAPAPIESPADLEPAPSAPNIDVPEFIFPEEPVAEEKPLAPPVVPPPLPPEPEPEPELLIQEPVQSPEPMVSLPAVPPPEFQPEPEPAPWLPEPVPQAEPKLEPVPPAPIPEPVPAIDSRDEWRRLMADDQPRVAKPIEEPKKLKPAPPKPLKPEIKKPSPVPIGERRGFFDKLKSAWSPTPRKPVLSPKPVEIPKPVIAPPKAIDVPQPKPVGGFGQKLATFFKPKPRSKPVKPVVKTGLPVKPVPRVEPVQPVQPVQLVRPVEPLQAVPSLSVAVPKPRKEGFFAKLFKPRPRKVIAKAVHQVTAAPVQKPVAPVKPVVKKPLPVPKPKREKIPRGPIDHVALWSPWVLGIAGIVCSAFRDFGFEIAPAILWGVAGWCVGYMVRLTRVYPLKSFQESTLQALSDLGIAGARGKPVLLKGQIVLANEEQPKGEVVFRQEEKTLFLNRLARWDMIPRLFGLSNPRQLLKGDVTLKGWYRPGPSPSLEVHELRLEKTVRKSMARNLRWASSIFSFLIVLAIYLSLE